LIFAKFFNIISVNFPINTKEFGDNIFEHNRDWSRC